MRRGRKHPALEILLSLPFVCRLDCQPHAGQGSLAFLSFAQCSPGLSFPGVVGPLQVTYFPPCQNTSCLNMC